MYEDSTDVCEGDEKNFYAPSNQLGRASQPDHGCTFDSLFFSLVWFFFALEHLLSVAGLAELSIHLNLELGGVGTAGEKVLKPLQFE